MSLRTIEATRYVTPLREGGSLPGIVEADEEVQDLLTASAGRNLGSDFLPGSFGYDGSVGDHTGPLPEAAAVLWPDAFTANVDRTWRNPNLLVWNGALHVIDHGACLYFHHAWPGGVGDPHRIAGQSWDPSGHVLLDRVDDLAGGAARGLPGVPGRPAQHPSMAPGGDRMSAGMPCQYVALRCVPRVDREEFLNVGVVGHVDRDRLADVHPGLDLGPGMRRPRLRRRRVHRRPGRRGSRSGVGEPAVRVPQGAAQHRRPAGPGARRRHHRPRQLERLLHQLVG